MNRLFVVCLVLLLCCSAAWCGGAGGAKQLLTLVPDNLADPVLIVSLPPSAVSFDGPRGRVELVGAVKDGAIVPISELGLNASELQFVTYPTKGLQFDKFRSHGVPAMRFTSSLRLMPISLGVVEKQNGKLTRGWWARGHVNLNFFADDLYPKGPNNRPFAAIAPMR